jgi:SH3 domain protein
MQIRRYLIILSLHFSLTTTLSWAAGAYITDSFEVMLRTGPSNQNKIIAMPSSGQAVTVIEKQGDWSRVRLLTGDGGEVEGWVLSRYIIARMPWELQTNAAEKENATLEEKLAQVEEERNELKSRETELSSKLQAVTSRLEKVQGEYDSLSKGAAEYLTLKKDFDAAKSVLESNRRTLEVLSVENRELKSSHTHRWLLTGAAILLCGLIIGLVMGRRQKSRRSLYS